MAGCRLGALDAAIPTVRSIIPLAYLCSWIRGAWRMGLLTELISSFLFGMLLDSSLCCSACCCGGKWLAAAAFILIPASGGFGNARPGIEAPWPVLILCAVRCNPAPVWRIAPDDRMLIRGQHSGALSDRGFLHMVREHNRLSFGSRPRYDRLRFPHRCCRATTVKDRLP
jgi:hypothetical protein